MKSLSLFDLKGKIILITGGYGHLGTAISKGLEAHNAIVLVLGRYQNKFEKVFGANANIHFVHGDVSESSSLKETFQKIKTDYLAIDVIINNAFYLKGQQPLKIDDEDWAYGLEGTVSSVYKCIREVVPYMIEQNHGKIINVGSMYGVVSPDFEIYKKFPEFLNPPHYGAGKAAIIQLTKYYASYLGKYNIQVNTISPGPFPSNSVKNTKGFIDLLEHKTSLGRIGLPEELIGPFVFLCSEASSYVTGHNLIVDGGWTIT